MRRAAVFQVLATFSSAFVAKTRMPYDMQHSCKAQKQVMMLSSRCYT